MKLPREIEDSSSLVHLSESTWNLLLAELTALSKIASQPINGKDRESSSTVAPRSGET